MRYTDIAGKTYGILTAVKYIKTVRTSPNAKGRVNFDPYFLFKCECGNEILRRKKDVVGGSIRTCGELECKRLCNAKFGKGGSGIP